MWDEVRWHHLFVSGRGLFTFPAKAGCVGTLETAEMLVRKREEGEIKAPHYYLSLGGYETKCIHSHGLWPHNHSVTKNSPTTPTCKQKNPPPFIPGRVLVLTTKEVLILPGWISEINHPIACWLHMCVCVLGVRCDLCVRHMFVESTAKTWFYLITSQTDTE